MKNEYKINSDRYGHTHKFVSTSRCSNPYIFVPEKDWMPLYCTAGWNNDEIIIERIEGGKVGPILFYLKEKTEE